MTESTFGVKVLQSLQADGYRPHAWWGMLAASWRQARVTAAAQPRLTRDWQWLTGNLGVATLGIVAYTAQRHGPRVAWRSVAPLLLTTMLQAGDLYVHLGMHRRGDGTTQARLGTATTLTEARGWLGAVIGSRLVASAPLTDAETLAALALIVATDIADGPYARWHDSTSPLGGYLDGETDMVAWSALTLTQWRRGQVPPWFVFAFGMRWGVPLILGLGQTFTNAAPVTLASSRFARAVGAAQVAVTATATLAAIRRDKADAGWWVRAKQGLVAITGSLLLATTIRHSTRLLRAHHHRHT